MKHLLEGLVVAAIFTGIGVDIQAKTLEEVQDLAKEHCYSGHVEKVKFGNIEAFDITCENDNGETYIYNYVPEQLVMTHFIEN